MKVDLYDPLALNVLRKHRDNFLAGVMGAPSEPTTAQEIAAAREAGVWRDVELVHHDEVIRRILAARDALTARLVANRFTVGLGQGLPALRSAISSYAIAMHLEPHAVHYPSLHFPCATCGLRRQPDGTPYAELDWNACLLSRCEVGGTTSLTYVLADLEDFNHLPGSATPSDSDVEALRRLLNILRNQPPVATPGKLAKSIGTLGGKNANQKTRLVEVLGIIGILEPRNHPSYLTAFTPFAEREGPNGRNDWDYPSIWWRGTDGVNEEAVQTWFTHLLDG